MNVPALIPGRGRVPVVCRGRRYGDPPTLFEPSGAPVDNVARLTQLTEHRFDQSLACRFVRESRCAGPPPPRTLAPSGDRPGPIMTLTVLFCADPLNPRRADPHFAREAATVTAGGGTAAILDHDALQRGDVAEAVRHVPKDLGSAWYRGWMTAGAQY